MKRILFAITLCFWLSFTFVTPISAQEGFSAWSGCQTANAVYNGVATFQGIECIVQRILNLAITFVGLGVLVMIVIGAYQLIMSGGDPKGVAAGRQTITFAILGLVLALSSWFIINIIASVTGAEQIREFDTTPIDQQSK